MQHITKIFIAMEKLLEEEKSATNELQNCCWPVSKNWKEDTGLVSGLENALKPSQWFIADTAPLRTIFAGVVPLLDIEIDQLSSMKQLLRRAGLEYRFLSKNAKSIPRTQGSVEFNQELTDALRKKTDFIIRYTVPKWISSTIGVLPG